MALAYSYSTPQPYDPNPDIFGNFARGYQAVRQPLDEANASQSLSALGQSLEQPAQPGGKPALSQYGLPSGDVLLPLLQNPQTRDQAIGMIRDATAKRDEALDPVKQLQIAKLKYDVAHQGDGPVNTIARDAATRLKLGMEQGLSGDALKQFTLTGKLPSAAGENLINAGGGQLYDPNTKTWISAPTDTASGSAALPPVSFNDSGVPDPAQQDAFLQSLDPSTAALVKGVANYQLDPTKVTTLRGDQRQKFIGLVQQFDPTFDMSQYGARAQAKKAYTTGQQGQTITSANTVIGHLSNLADDAEKLGNGDFAPLNAVVNAGKNAMSNADLAKFNSDKMAVASELAKFFKGTGATDLTTTQEWQSIFDQNAGQGALKAVVQNVIGNLMKSRLDEMRSQYTAAMDKPADFKFITPETDRVLKKLGIKASDLDPAMGDGATSGDAADNDPLGIR